MTWTARLALLALALAGVTCKTVAPYRAEAPDPSKDEGNWAEVRGAATRRAQLYDRFMHRATVTATYMSTEVREARNRRLESWLGWTEPELKRARDADRAETAKYEEFLVGFYTADRWANDLEAPNSVWRVSLRLENGEELVSRDAEFMHSNTTLTGLYPYLSVFDTIYRVRFNRAPGEPLAGRRFELEFSSGMGKLTLTFGDGTMGPIRPDGIPLP